jgi:DNA polymerase III beta subunit, central domain
VSVTINAHQLGLMLDKTTVHMGGDHNEQLHGIRLDMDSSYLYAVATDAYTIAAARYGLNHGDCDQEPWQALLPGEHATTVREWARAMKGADWITVSLAKDRLVFEGPNTDLNITVNTALEYPDWRGLFRRMTAQTVDGEPFPALNSDYMQRWASAEQSLRTRVTADRKAVLFFGEDFIGAQMPTSGGGIGPSKNQTFGDAQTLWLWTLSAGATDVDMASLPKPTPPRFDASHDISETASYLLRGVLDSTHNAQLSDWDEDQDAWFAHIRSGVSGWMAYRFLDALHQVDPRAAQAVVDDTAEQLDSGELGEWAWDMAEQSGFKPKQWQDDQEKRVAKQMAEEPRKWAVRLAHALNDAKQAGINFRVDDNQFVAYDAEAEDWKAVAPQPAEPADTTA